METISNSFNTLKSAAEKEVGMQSQFIPFSLADLLLMNFPENAWAINKIIPREGVTIISGAPGSYKTWLLLQMAMNIAEGSVFLDQFPCEQANVLIIDEENHPRILQDRLHLMNARDDLPIYFLSQEGFLASDDPGVDRVLAICQEYSIGVVFIDSLVRINSADENKASEMSQVFQRLQKFCKENVTLVITHHERKENPALRGTAQNRMRGSSDISAAIDAHLSVTRDKDARNIILIEQAKLRYSQEMDPFQVSIESTPEKVSFSYHGQLQKPPKKETLARNAIVRVLNDRSLSKSQIIKEVRKKEKIGEKSIRHGIDSMVFDKILIKEQGDRNTKIYSLAETKTPQENPA